MDKVKEIYAAIEERGFLNVAPPSMLYAFKFSDNKAATIASLQTINWLFGMQNKFTLSEGWSLNSEEAK